MNDIALWNSEQRRELFNTTALMMKVHPAIIEKDFWVCWLLKILFETSKWQKSLIFKGGTSLSKVYGIIDRFSEDIDLVLDWRLLGYSEENPWRATSNTQKSTFVKRSTSRSETFLREVFLPSFQSTIESTSVPGLHLTLEGQIVKILYPKSFALDAIQPQVILEIGPLASWTPHESASVVPYVAEYNPQLFNNSKAKINVVTAARTFWEKATILHQEYNRPLNRPMPNRYSRHYYDLYKYIQSAYLQEAMANRTLLEQVIRFKNQFYYAAWADLKAALHGKFHLIPPPQRIQPLAKDYASMQDMIFQGKAPTFNQILEGLASLEKDLNT